MKKLLPILALFITVQAFADNIPYSIRVVEQHSKSPISDAYVRAIDLTEGKTIIAASNDSGFVALQLNMDNKYRIDISKSSSDKNVKYITYSYFVTGLEILRPSFSEIKLEKVRVNSLVQLSNIYFDPTGHELDGKDKMALANTLIALKNSPSLTVEIGIHIDCKETDEVALKRVAAIQEYFSNKGDLAKRITVKNYGKSSPLAGCNCDSPMVTPDEVYAANRVAEFRILNF